VSKQVHQPRSGKPASEESSLGGREHHPFSLSPLPYGEDALEPVISSKTVSLHHDKHHRGYVEKLNELVAGTRFSRLSLVEIVRATNDDEEHVKIFENAGQALNHDFYWRSLSPRGGKPSGRTKSLLDRAFGGYDSFVEAFTLAATHHFGSGWAWLVFDGDELAITTTANADTPVVDEVTPLLTVDVWEHAYYLDYQNRREEHVRSVVEKLLDWDFAAATLASEID
jgi:Fe-Mn family superoxide dismutase